MPDPHQGRSRFADHNAIVVGGDVGIGRATSQLLAAEGATVLIVGADRAAGDVTCRRVREAGGRAEFAFAEPDDVHAPMQVLETMEARPVDVFVHHSAQLAFAGVESDSIASWEAVVRANLTAPFAWSQACLSRMKQRGGSVVLIGSVDGIHGNPQIASYSASKGGLVALTHVMAAEFAPYGIRVNCVARVGTTEDEADSAAPPELFDRLRAATPLGRLPDPAELAAAVAFLASGDASYVTGTVLTCDGGRTAVTPGTWSHSAD